MDRKKAIEIGIQTTVAECPEGHSHVIDVRPYAEEIEIFEDGGNDNKYAGRSSAARYAEGWERIWGKKTEEETLN